MNVLNKQNKGKTWWSPIWRGLVVDPKARHYKQMKNAIWLFVYLLIYANRKTGELWRRHDTIASDMGIHARTVRRLQSRLLRHGYITVTRAGRSHVIHIQKWKPLRPPSKQAKSGSESGQLKAL